MPRLTRHARQALVLERQKQILDAAARVFSEKGFAHATIRDIARAAGVSDGTIYLYFKNKQDLLVHLPGQFIQPPLEMFRTAQMPPGAPPPPPEQLLQFIAENIVNVVTHNRELMRVLFNSLPTMDAETRATYMREGPAYAIEMIETYIRRQQAAGVFRADIDPAIAARVLPGMMLFFLLVQEVLQPAALARFEYARVIPNVIQIYLRGIMTAPSAPGARSAPEPTAAPEARPPARRKNKLELE